MLLLLVVVGRGGGKHLGLPMLRGGHGHGCRSRNGVVERRGRVPCVLLLRALNLHVVVLLLLRQSEALVYMSVREHHQRPGLWSSHWE